MAPLDKIMFETFLRWSVFKSNSIKPTTITEKTIWNDYTTKEKMAVKFSE